METVWGLFRLFKQLHFVLVLNDRTSTESFARDGISQGSVMVASSEKRFAAERWQFFKMKNILCSTIFFVQKATEDEKLYH